MYENSLVGEVNYTKSKIDKLIKENNIDEIAILSWCHDEAARIKSYKLFADAFNLSSQKSLSKNLSLSHL
jgi:hypothetical protein